ncbi:NAD(P)-binding domain-containing protein [Nocardia sp. R16R-3T]
MKTAVLGTGQVGRGPAGKLVELGHAVTLGSRSADNAAATECAGETEFDARGDGPRPALA